MTVEDVTGDRVRGELEYFQQVFRRFERRVLGFCRISNYNNTKT